MILELLKKKQGRYRKVFESEEGKEVLKDLYKQCKPNASSFNSDTHQMAFSEGRKSVFLYIINTLGQDLEKLVKENDNE